MAPVSARRSVTYTNKPSRRRQSADRVRRVLTVGWPGCVTSPTTDRGQHRRRRRRHGDPGADLRSSLLPRRCRLPRCHTAAAAADDKGEDEDYAGRVPSSPHHRSNSNALQRHLMTVLYCAALVDQLTLKLSRLQVQTNANSSLTKNNAQPSPSSSSSSGDCSDERDVHRAVSASTDGRRGSQRADSSSPPPGHDDRHEPTSMFALLRTSSRIPRPVAQYYPHV